MICHQEREIPAQRCIRDVDTSKKHSSDRGQKLSKEPFLPCVCCNFATGRLRRHVTQRLLLCAADVPPVQYELMQRRSSKKCARAFECSGDEAISARPSWRHASFNIACIPSPKSDIARTPHKAAISRDIKGFYFRVWAKQRTDPFE